MLLKSRLEMKYCFQYIKVIRLLQHSSANSNRGDWGCIVRAIEIITILVLLAFNYIARRFLILPTQLLR